MTRRRRLASVALLFGLAVDFGGCTKKTGEQEDEFVGLGVRGSTDEPPAGVLRPVTENDLKGLQTRGKLLFDMERTLMVGYEQGVFSVGAPGNDVILPLVDVDPGGASSQAVFVRWPRQEVGEHGELNPDDAHRWLLVSLLLNPDRLLDVELLAGKIEPKTPEHERVAALLLAASELRTRSPNQMFHLYAVQEIDADNSRGLRRQILVRVYALSAEGKTSDYELVVGVPRRKRKLEVLEVTKVHDPQPQGANPISMKEAPLSAATVARVMMRGPAAGDVVVRARSGDWRVSPGSGHIVRATADNDPTAPKSDRPW